MEVLSRLCLFATLECLLLLSVLAEVAWFDSLVLRIFVASCEGVDV